MAFYQMTLVNVALHGTQTLDIPGKYMDAH